MATTPDTIPDTDAEAYAHGHGLGEYCKHAHENEINYDPRFDFADAAKVGRAHFAAFKRGFEDGFDGKPAPSGSKHRTEHTGPKAHQCPKCGAEPGVSCMDARFGPQAPRFLDWFHADRKALS